MISAAEILQNQYQIDSNVWSVTSFSELRKEALEIERYNLLHPDSKPKKAFVEKCNDLSMLPLDAGWTDLGSWVSLRAFEANHYPSIYENSLDTKIERPWGFFQILLETSSTKLKLIKVMPKQKLSLQKHKFRSERWHVIKGRAKVVRDDEKFTLELGDTIDIKKSQTHSLENVEDAPLEIVEIQSGEYLGEDDIIRLEDIYGRADLH